MINAQASVPTYYCPSNTVYEPQRAFPYLSNSNWEAVKSIEPWKNCVGDSLGLPVIILPEELKDLKGFDKLYEWLGFSILHEAIGERNFSHESGWDKVFIYGFQCHREDSKILGEWKDPLRQTHFVWLPDVPATTEFLPRHVIRQDRGNGFLSKITPYITMRITAPENLYGPSYGSIIRVYARREKIAN